MPLYVVSSVSWLLVVLCCGSCEGDTQALFLPCLCCLFVPVTVILSFWSRFEGEHPVAIFFFLCLALVVCSPWQPPFFHFCSRIEGENVYSFLASLSLSTFLYLLSLTSSWYLTQGLDSLVTEQGIGSQIPFPTWGHYEGTQPLSYT